MNPPSALVVPPLLLAMLVFGWRFYRIDPLRRVTDPNMLVAIGSLVLALTYAFTEGTRSGPAALPWLACVAGWGLLIGGIVWTIRRPPVRDTRPDPEPRG